MLSNVLNLSKSEPYMSPYVNETFNNLFHGAVPRVDWWVFRLMVIQG